MAGLGNPGPRYEHTRHNVGFVIVDRLARRLVAGSWQEVDDALQAGVSSGEKELLLLKPQTYMNLSGNAVKSALAKFSLDSEGLIVVHDDLDLEFGSVRIKKSGGHGGHNGIRSVMEHLETGEFIRLRVGVGRPPEGVDVVEHVLGAFSEEEAPALDGLIERCVDAIEHIFEDGPEGAMQRFHTKRTNLD